MANVRRPTLLLVALLLAWAAAGCGQIPVVGRVDSRSEFVGRADVAATVAARVEGPIEVAVPAVPDPGPMAVVPVRAGSDGARVALVDVDGLLLNRGPVGPYSAGENQVAAFRERLDAIAADPTIRAVVLRINSPGGEVTACDIMAEELRRFRERTGLPVVSCLMELGTSGAYYLAVGGDRVLAHPTTITGGIGARFNRYNLRDAMAQFNVIAEPITTGPMVDMASVADALSPEAEALLGQMADDFAARFRDRVAGCRPQVTADDWQVLADGRVLPASEAMERHLVDGIGYLDDAIAEAERLSGIGPGAEVVLLKRRGDAARSIYAATSNRPIQGDLVPFSLPGLDRERLPAFLYLWAPDPTVLAPGGG